LFLKTNESTHSPHNVSNISSLSPLSSISNSSETNNNSKQLNKSNCDQWQFKNDWNSTFNGQQKNSSNAENEQDADKALDLKQQDFRQHLANNSNNKKIKSDFKPENENGLLQSLFASNQNLNSEMSTLHLNQMQQLNWLLNQKTLSQQTNKLNQNNSNATVSGNFPNENFNCLNTFFNSNLIPQTSPSQSMSNINNFPMNLSAYQIGKSPFGFNNPFSMANQAIAAERANTENASVLANQAEMMLSSKKILELFNCINIMSGNGAANSMNLNAAAALLSNQMKNGESNVNNLNLIENQNVMAAAQQLNLALSSMSNAAGL
jgi:hypothetical protein